MDTEENPIMGCGLMNTLAISFLGLPGRAKPTIAVVMGIPHARPIIVIPTIMRIHHAARQSRQNQSHQYEFHYVLSVLLLILILPRSHAGMPCKR